MTSPPSAPDLVARLRDRKAHIRNMEYQETHPTIMLCEEAAAEIEHLQEQEAALREIHREDQAEIDRLREGGAEALALSRRLMGDKERLTRERDLFFASLNEVGAERDRLRAMVKELGGDPDAGR